MSEQTYLPTTDYILTKRLIITQSPYGISTEHTSHIQETILIEWFTDSSEKVNSSLNPFKADSTFEIILAEILPSNPAELHILE